MSNKKNKVVNIVANEIPNKPENVVKLIIVSPKNNRLYHYWINGSHEKRTMLQHKIREYCLTLAPEFASEINECISEVRPFVLDLESKTFREPKEKKGHALPKDNIFPMRNKIINHKNLTPQKKPIIEQQKDKFNIIRKIGKITKNSRELLKPRTL